MMNINKIRNIHFSGIKGVGMTALALYARDMGKKITGSDIKEEFVTQEVLKKGNFQLSIGFHRENIPQQTDLLIYSAAHTDSPEIDEARKRNISILSYAQALAAFTRGKKVIATCGVGGKSTTGAMLASVLSQANLKPSFIVGVGDIPGLGTPGAFDRGKYAVVEADEYVAVPGVDNTAKFLYLNPAVIVVTNIEYDHPDVYENLDETKRAFENFFHRLPSAGLLVANIDSKNVQSLLDKIRTEKPQISVETYGFSPQATWYIESVEYLNKRVQVSLLYSGVQIDLTLRIPGRFNAANATAALAVATHLGVAQKISVEALQSFQGTKRRFQHIGMKNGVGIWDDYAHHPNQIRATILAAKEWFRGSRLVVVFQPHTFSRTKALLGEFAKALSLADEVIVTEIYSSTREKKDPSITGAMLAQRTAQSLKGTRHIKRDAVLEYIEQSTKKGDFVMTLGAGDIYKVAEQFVESR